MGILTLETNKYALKLENFEGPLDLLCHLIDKSKMDIYDVKLSDITDQYIEYINEMEKQNLEVTSEFLVIATTLVYLKSKELPLIYTFLLFSLIIYLLVFYDRLLISELHLLLLPSLHFP